MAPADCVPRQSATTKTIETRGRKGRGDSWRRVYSPRPLRAPVSTLRVGKKYLHECNVDGRIPYASITPCRAT
jgi:hypothetical protein